MLSIALYSLNQDDSYISKRGPQGRHSSPSLRCQPNQPFTPFPLQDPTHNTISASSSSRQSFSNSSPLLIRPRECHHTFFNVIETSTDRYQTLPQIFGSIARGVSDGNNASQQPNRVSSPRLADAVLPGSTSVDVEFAVRDQGPSPRRPWCSRGRRSIPGGGSLRLPYRHGPVLLCP
jgi:hypothetical protein